MLDGEFDKINHLWTLSFAAFMVMVAECFCFGCAFCCAGLNKHGWGDNVSRTWREMFEEGFHYMSLIKHGG